MTALLEHLSRSVATQLTAACVLTKRALTKRMRARRVLTVPLLVASLTAPAWAQGTDVGAAELLFQEAKQLLDEGNVDEACPKFAESFRLDAGTGTLLGLAICHEKQGRLATAWAEYLEVKGRAKRDGDTARLDYAEQRATELEPRLSTLSIEVRPEVAATSGLEITRNGVPVGKGSWNVPVPLDGEDYVVEARAPSRKTWTQTVTLQVEATKGKVVIPSLEIVQEATPGPAAGSPGPEDEGPPKAPLTKMNGVRWAGVGTAAAGLVSLGVGGYFLSGALEQFDQSESECEGDRCNDRGTKLREDAVSDGNLATIFGIAGAALVGTGAVLFFVVGDEGTAASAQPHRVAASLGPGGVGVTLEGSF